MVVNALRAIRWTFSTSGQALVYLASAGGLLAAMLAGWGFADGARWAMFVSLLFASPYLTALLAVQLLRMYRDAALILLFVASLASGLAASMSGSSISGLVLWSATPILFLATLLIALGELSFDRRQVGS